MKCQTDLKQDEYHAACQYTHHSESEPLATEQQTQPVEDNVQISDITIGQYGNCHYVASGVTAEVYRSENRALKIITETRNIEPHNPAREAKILLTLKRSCIPLLETFWDQEQRFVLVFPYMPTSLEALIAQGSIPLARVKKHFMDLFSALEHIHEQGIIHRDIKPSAVLLASPDGPAYLSDFGTAWHPTLSAMAEPKDQKILDIGTGAYRAPEVLFGNKSYGTAVDMWGAGAMLAECSRSPPQPLFESRPVHEDGNQLGLILSIFKTIGSPTRETWPEAANFKTPPFEMYRPFEQHTWEEILPRTRPDFRSLIASLVHYNSDRATASQASTQLKTIDS
jgi:cyclin-dependent kinase